MLNFVEGTIKIANIFLSLIAGLLAFTLLQSTKKRDLRPWMLLIFALALFVLQELLGMLRAFEIWSSPFLTHMVPTFILILVLWALSIQLRLGGKK